MKDEPEHEKRPHTEPASQIENDELLTPEQLSERLQLSLTTIYNKLGQLGEEDGVLRLGPRCTRIEWTKFMDRLRKGKIKLEPKGIREDQVS